MSAHLCVTLTSFGLKVGDAVHDDVVKEQWLVVDLDVSGEQAAEVLHIPGGGEKEDINMLLCPLLSNTITNVLQQRDEGIILCSSQQRDTVFGFDL